MPTHSMVYRHRKSGKEMWGVYDVHNQKFYSFSSKSQAIAFAKKLGSFEEVTK